MNTNPTRKRARKRLFIRKTKRATKAGLLTVWRLVLFAVMLLLLLGCVAWILFLRAFNAQHISEVITQQLQARLNRPVRISSLELKFINTLELKGFTVLDTVGEPGQAFVSADSVTLAFDLLPLLEHKLVVHEVTLNAPRFNLVRMQEGVYNVPQVHTVKQPSVYTSRGGNKFTVSIEDWRVRDGVFRFKDLVSGASHSLYGVNARFDSLQLSELSHFTLEMVLRNQWKGRISELEIYMNGHVNFANFDWQKLALRDVKTQVSLFKKPVDITLDADNLASPSFKITLTAPAFEAADLSQFGDLPFAFAVPASTLTVQGQFTQDYNRLALSQVSVKAGDISLTASASADFAQEPVALQAQFSTELFNLAGKEKMYPALTRYHLGGQAALGGKVIRQNGRWELPLFTARAESVSGDIYGFMANRASGEFQAKSNFTDLYARTTGGQVTVDRSVFDNLKLSASWRKGTLYGNIASAELNGEPVKINVNIKNLKSPKRKVTANVYFKNFAPISFIDTVQDFVTVISRLSPPGHAAAKQTGDLAWLRNFKNGLPNFMPNFSGTLTADTFTSGVLTGNRFNAQFDLTALQSGGEHLSGPIRLRLENGVIHQMEKWAEEQEALNVTFQPFIMMHRMERAGSFSVGKVLRDVEVEELGVSVNFDKGRMQIQNAYTVGPTISAAISGWADWVKETLDLTVFTMFANTSKSGVLAENLTDESGNPALAFRLSSTMLKPKVEMLRAKKAGSTIRTAQQNGVGTDFETSTTFIQGEHHATK